MSLMVDDVNVLICVKLYEKYFDYFIILSCLCWCVYFLSIMIMLHTGAVNGIYKLVKDALNWACFKFSLDSLKNLYYVYM